MTDFFFLKFSFPFFGFSSKNFRGFKVYKKRGLRIWENWKKEMGTLAPLDSDKQSQQSAIGRSVVL